MNACFQPPLYAVPESHFAAVGAGNLAGNRQTQSGAARLAVARTFDTIKRLEYLFDFVGT